VEELSVGDEGIGDAQQRSGVVERSLDVGVLPGLLPHGDE